MTKTTEENLSQSKYAEHRNVTKGYIGRMVKEGRLHLIKGKLNVKMLDAELDNKSNDEKAPNYWIEKALHEKAKRELAELDLKLKQDQLVELDQVGLHLDLIFSAVRQRLLATPSKIAKTGREKVSDSKCNLVKIENLYKNIFTQVPVTGAEPFQDSLVPPQDLV